MGVRLGEVGLNVKGVRPCWELGWFFKRYLFPRRGRTKMMFFFFMLLFFGDVEVGDMTYSKPCEKRKIPMSASLLQSTESY